jgi:hypothetical protein
MWVLLATQIGACTYGRVTFNGTPVASAIVSIESCSRTWTAMSDSNGIYAFDPYNKAGQLVNTSQYIADGSYLLIASPPKGSSAGPLAMTITVAPWSTSPPGPATCNADASDSTSPIIPCQQFNAALPAASATSAMTAARVVAAFRAACPAPVATVPKANGSFASQADISISGQADDNGPIGAIAIASNVGTVTVNGIALPALTHTYEHWDSGQQMLQTIVVSPTAWYILWIYGQNGVVQTVWYESTDGMTGAFQGATGSYTVADNVTGSVVSFPSSALKAPPLVGGVNIQGPLLSYDGVHPGSIWLPAPLAAPPRTIYPFVLIDCTKCASPGKPGWYELHSLVVDVPTKNQASFVILYLYVGFQNQVGLSNGITFPDLIDTRGPNYIATWTLAAAKGTNDPEDGVAEPRAAQEIVTTCAGSKTWKDVRGIDFDLTDDAGKTVLHVELDQARGVMRMYDPDKATWSEGAPGDATVLRTKYAALDLGASAVKGHGPDDPVVDVHWSLTFSEAAIGQYTQYLSIDEEAGRVQDRQSIGTYRVAGKRGCDAGGEPYWLWILLLGTVGRVAVTRFRGRQYGIGWPL